MVDAEPLGELDLRGHEAPLNGWRVTADRRRGWPSARRPRARGSADRPRRGAAACCWTRDAARKQGNKSSLFTIFGVPGVGKSRLVARGHRATRRQTAGRSSSGRCLPYGDGITYWPVAEMVRELAGIDAADIGRGARARLAAVSAGRRAWPTTSPWSSAPAIDRTSQRARAAATARSPMPSAAWSSTSDRTRGPLVLIFEDIHWAEPPLLDLIEYLVTWTRDAPLLVICPSAPGAARHSPGVGQRPDGGQPDLASSR